LQDPYQKLELRCALIVSLEIALQSGNDLKVLPGKPAPQQRSGVVLDNAIVSKKKETAYAWGI